MNGLRRREIQLDFFEQLHKNKNVIAGIQSPMNRGRTDRPARRESFSPMKELLMKQEILIVRPVQVLRGYRNIAAALRTSEEKVRDMIGYGAPVVLDGDMPKAEAAELWTWYARGMGEGGARGSC